MIKLNQQTLESEAQPDDEPMSRGGGVEMPAKRRSIAELLKLTSTRIPGDPAKDWIDYGEDGDGSPEQVASSDDDGDGWLDYDEPSPSATEDGAGESGDDFIMVDSETGSVDGDYGTADASTTEEAVAVADVAPEQVVQTVEDTAEALRLLGTVTAEEQQLMNGMSAGELQVYSGPVYIALRRVDTMLMNETLPILDEPGAEECGQISELFRKLVNAHRNGDLTDSSLVFTITTQLIPTLRKWIRSSGDADASAE